MKITLISWPTEPLKAIYCAVENMKGNMIHDLSKIDKSDCLKTLEELKKTALKGSLEFGGDYIFQIEGVPRAFTHQCVRNRVGASYSQESMRFAVKSGDKFDYYTGESIKLGIGKELFYNSIMEKIHESYEDLIDGGVKTEDARGVLPINTLTKIGVRFNLMTLIKIAEVRLCYQSQGHWREVVEGMKREICEKVSPEISELMVKACDRTGKCEFKSIFDRECPVEDELIRKVCNNCTIQEACRKADGEFCKAIKKFMLKEGKNEN